MNVLGPGYDDLTSSALQSAAAAAAADSQSGEATAASSGARWLSEDPVSVEGPFDRVDPVRARQAAVLAAMRVVNKVYTHAHTHTHTHMTQTGVHTHARVPAAVRKVGVAPHLFAPVLCHIRRDRGSQSLCVCVCVCVHRCFS